MGKIIKQASVIQPAATSKPKRPAENNSKLKKPGKPESLNNGLFWLAAILLIAFFVFSPR
jgi:hypothetical protein